MARKKDTQTTTLSPEENQQVTQQLTQYHDLAQSLQHSNSREQAEAALADVNALPESVQFGLLKALARENENDAADILLALHTFSPSKEVRKEARRSLIRLEGTKIYPRWAPPSIQAPTIQVNVAQPPRFWKGFVTQARDQGESHLLLAWEQGYDYSEVRAITLHLDYWQEGIDDAAIETISKRRYNENIEDLRSKLTDITLVDCTLAEGKRLIEEALSVNEWRSTPLPAEFRHHRALIDTLILQAPPSELGEDSGRTFIDPELTEHEVAINFLGAWSLGDYGLAYDLLSSGSTLRQRLGRDEWIGQRRDWNTEAQPARLELGFVDEHEARQGAIWVPTAIRGGRTGSRKEIEVGWSLELKETPVSGVLDEMPMGTAVNKETGRHWFWTSYTLQRERDGWRIERSKDEGASVQKLPIQELQNTISSSEEAIQERVNRRGDDVQEFVNELARRLSQLMHYYDALIAQLPLDRKVLDDAYNRSIALGNPELSMVYLDRLRQRFPDYRGETLRNLGATQIAYAFSERLQQMPERRQQFLAMAEATLREALTQDNTARGHLLLAELFMSTQRNDEAEKELELARTLQPGREDEAVIESGLGNLALRREQAGEALTHFKRVAELDAAYPGIWYNLGFAQRLQGNFEDAEASYQRAITVDPNDTRIYAELIALYMNRKEPQQARNIAEQGIRANPESAELRALLSSVLFELGEQRAAQQRLTEAEQIDPTSGIVRNVRQHYQSKVKKR